MNVQRLSLLFTFLFCSSISHDAKGAETDPICQESIAEVARTVQGRYQANILEVIQSSIPSYHKSPFQGANLRVLFALGSDKDFYGRTPQGKQDLARINNFLASHQLQLKLASTILSKCPKINLVEFAQSGSGYINPFFRMPSGKHQGAIFLPCDPVRYPGATSWGFTKSC